MVHTFWDGENNHMIEKPPKVVQSECPVCLQILREPYQADCCGYAFCWVCIERVKAAKKPCPWCKAEKFDKFEDKRLKQTLYEFKVYHANKEQGYQWVGELGQLDNKEKQLEGCLFTRVNCHHCSELVKRVFVQIHQDKQCPRRPFSCKYCKAFDSAYEDVSTNHWPECGYYPVQCTNTYGKTITRQNLNDHVSNDCPLTVKCINCDFSHVGCEAKLPRKDMLAHLTKNVIQHVSLHAASHKQLKNENE